MCGSDSHTGECVRIFRGGVAGPLEGVIIRRDHFDGATMSSAAFGVDVISLMVEKDESKGDRNSTSLGSTHRAFCLSSNALEDHHSMMSDEDVIGVIRRVADTVSSTTSASPERVARTCAVLAECGLDP